MITIDPRAGTAGTWHWCRVCGEPAFTWIREQPNYARCTKHYGKNACAIEGCTRYRAAGEGVTPQVDWWICGAHWRAFVPPRSRARRGYNAFFRIARKRGGFDEDLDRRFWRYFSLLVRRARRLSDGGSIDAAEIERLFGL